MSTEEIAANAATRSSEEGAVDPSSTISTCATSFASRSTRSISGKSSEAAAQSSKMGTTIRRSTGARSGSGAGRLETKRDGIERSSSSHDARLLDAVQTPEQRIDRHGRDAVASVEAG